MIIRTNVQLIHKNLCPFRNLGIAVLHICLAGAQGFYLSAGQGDACFKGFKNSIVMARFAIFCDNFDSFFCHITPPPLRGPPPLARGGFYVIAYPSGSPLKGSCQRACALTEGFYFLFLPLRVLLLFLAPPLRLPGCLFFMPLLELLEFFFFLVSALKAAR